MRRLFPVITLVLCACPAPPPMTDDSGMVVVDSGPPPPSCSSPQDCKQVGYGGVCRQGACARHVPCADDLECGLGEGCLARECAFIGCIADSDCPSGRCSMNTFTCAECAASSDCPFNRPNCQLSTKKCVQCEADLDCPAPGPAHCEPVSGQCVHCLTDDHCPNGLICNGGVCAGAPKGGACPMGTSCAEGLTCVTLGTQQTCLQACNAFSPQCPMGEICYTLQYSMSSSYVFDEGGLLGVCFTPVSGARNYRDSCMKDSMGRSNCQPSLQCIPDTSSTSTCRSYCDPGAPNSCPTPEVCHHFSGDFYGREYGLCYPNNGWGTRCTADNGCDGGQSCQPYDDPAALGELSPTCQFNVGAQPGLAPCANVRTVDGGLVPPDKVCQSGYCKTDQLPATTPYFCFSACGTDSDCNLGGRSGSCDYDYTFLAPSGVNAFIAGCRPGCSSNDSCQEYGLDAGLVCRPRLVLGSSNSGLKLTCWKPNVGGQGAGAPCGSNTQCSSGFCSTDDARGVRRQGYCLEACQGIGQCATGGDAGVATGPLDCLPTTYLGYRGPDILPGTPDDVLSVKRVCSGAACVKDEDCSADGGVHCVPDVSPVDAGAYVLRCRPPTLGVKAPGVPCSLDSECVSGACGVAGGQRLCFQACDPVAPSPCPAGLTCQAGAFTFTATAGNTVSLAGCAP